MSRRALHFLQAVLALVIVVVAGRSVVHNWARLRSQPVVWQPHLADIVLALGVVWLMYALLIQAWRVMLRGWGLSLAPLPAARIWTVSSLGKYVPGQLWAIAGMAVMAQRAGVAAWAATASAVLLQGIAVGTGACVLGLTGGSLFTAYPSSRIVVPAVIALSIVGVALLLWQPFLRRALKLVGVEAERSAAPGAGHVVFGVIANAIAWLGYGTSLWCLARGLFDAPALTLARAVGAFTASYLAGFLAFGLPAGVGVREVVFISMLQGVIGAPTALALALASRLLLTCAEFGAAAPFLLSSPERIRAQS